MYTNKYFKNIFTDLISLWNYRWNKFKRKEILVFKCLEKSSCLYMDKNQIFFMLKKFNCYYNNRRRLITEENNYDYFKSFIVCEIT